MLTNIQIEELAPKMKVPLEFVGFKNDLPKKIIPNRAYIINLQDDVDQDTGGANGGSHWTCFQVVKYPNEKIEAIYFDSYGMAPPEIVLKRIKDNFKMKIPHTSKDIQSLMADTCGWYCMAFLHFINVFEHRSKNLYWDTETFLSLFDDLNKSINWKKNEYMLRQFFQPENPELREEIDVLPEYHDGMLKNSGTNSGVEGTTYESDIPVSVDVKYV